MENEQVKTLIQAGFPDDDIQVSGDGSHFNAIVVSTKFAEMSTVKKQQAVYATVTAQITSGEIHALSIKAYTPKEWESAQRLAVR